MQLTKAGELALSKISGQSVVTSAFPTLASNVKVISSGGKQINQPVQIITIKSPVNNAKTSSNVGKIQSKPTVINAPYLIPQINQTAAPKLQSQTGQKKDPKVIRLTQQQLADLKSGMLLVISYRDPSYDANDLSVVLTKLITF